MQYLNKIIFIILFINSAILFAENKSTVIFTIKNQAFTSTDLDQRINYIKLYYGVENIDQSDKKYLEDLISVSIFKLAADEINYLPNKKLIQEYFEDFLYRFEKRTGQKYENSQYIEDYPINIIIQNIEVDLQRKKIVENLISQNRDLLNRIKINKLISIFDISFEYFIIDNKFNDILENIKKDLINKKQNNYIDIFKRNNIEFTKNKIKISNISKLDKDIKNNLLSQNNKFILNKEQYYVFGIINKKLKKNIGLKYAFYQIKYKIDAAILDLEINCNNIKNLDNKNIEIKKFENIEIGKLNMEIIEEVVRKNDNIIVENKNQKYLLLLCNLEDNEKLLNNLNLESRQININKIGNDLETEFVSLKKNEYNLIIY